MSDLRKIKKRKELDHEYFNPNEKDMAFELKPIGKSRKEHKKEVSIKLSLEDLIELLHPSSDIVDLDTGDNLPKKKRLNEH